MFDSVLVYLFAIEDKFLLNLMQILQFDPHYHLVLLSHQRNQRYREYLWFRLQKGRHDSLVTHLFETFLGSVCYLLPDILELNGNLK
jgi:hypothetical protein